MRRIRLFLAAAIVAALTNPLLAQVSPKAPSVPPTFGVEDNPWRPYQVKGVLRADPLEGFASGTVATVPPGKLFVIDFITVDTALPIGQAPDQSILGIKLPGGPDGAGDLIFHSIKLEPMGATDSGFLTRWIFTGKVRLYATGEITYRVQRNFFLGDSGNKKGTRRCLFVCRSMTCLIWR